VVIAVTPGTAAAVPGTESLSSPVPVAVTIRPALIAWSALLLADFDSEAPNTEIAATRARPTMSAEAVWELWMYRWAAGFRDKIEEINGENAFAYYLAVTSLQRDASARTTDATIRECLGGNPLRFLTLERSWGAVLQAVTTTPAPSEMGRLAQLLKAAGLTAPVPIAPPSGPQAGSPGEAEEAEELASLD
jgi:hypothetical protein